MLGKFISWLLMVQLKIHPSPSNHTILCPAELRACSHSFLRNESIRFENLSTFVRNECLPG